jgi:hypothetical protein
MTRDVGELRRELTSYADEADFRISVDGVRRRVRQQRLRRMIGVVGVAAALAVLAIAGPVLLLGFPMPTPPTRSEDVVLPSPEDGWRRVGDPIRTGIRDVSAGDRELVLWFERRDNDVTRLSAGELDSETGLVTDKFRPGPGSRGGVRDVRPGGYGLYVPPGHWSFVAYDVQSDGASWGLYIGDAARIDIVSSGRTRQAKLARLGEDPRFVAYWLAGITGNGEAKPYDAAGKPMSTMRHPPDSHPPSPGEDLGDFDPVDAPRLGEPIRTGEERLKGTGLYPAPFPGESGVDPSGEVVLTFNGKDGYVGLVHSFQDPDSGAITGSYSGTRAYKLPFDKGPLPVRGEIGLGGGNGRTMAYGVVSGSVERLTATVDRLDLKIRWQTWSEDPDVVVWWVVIPSDKVEEDDARRVDLRIHYRDGTVGRDKAAPL